MLALNTVHQNKTSEEVIDLNKEMNQKSIPKNTKNLKNKRF